MPRWSNWSRTVVARPRECVMPPDEAAVVGVVQQALASGHTIKAVGAGHSWSDIAATDGVQVSLDAIRGLRSVDTQAGTATFGAGTRLREAVAALDAQGLAFPILGSIDHQSLAGATATATHGSSLSWGNLSSLVQGARLVDGRGEVRELGPDHPSLDGVRVHLGALGLLTELTMQVVPAFSLREERFAVSWGDAMTRLPELARESEYVKLWWLPHTDPVVVFRYVRTDAPSTVRPLARWVDEQVVNRFVFPGLLKIGSWFEPSVRWNNRIVGRSYFGPSVAVGPSAHMFTLAMPPRHREAEHAVGLEHATEALHRLRRVIDRRGLSVDFIVEARFVRGDTGWMSPAHGRDTAQIGAYMFRESGIDDYFDGFADEVAPLGARPHWGKEHQLTADECAELYPRYADFRALAGELDPDGVFRNAFVDRVLGPAGPSRT